MFVGCTCLENDRLFVLNNHYEVRIGDIIKFSFVGAYTICLSPLFIRYFPRIYVQNGNELLLSREEWTEKDYLQQNVLNS